MRMHRAAVVALFLAACAIVGVGGAHAGLLFEDDFERSVTTPIGYIGLWDGPPNPAVMYLTDATSHSGGRSVELRYVPGPFGASFMYRLYTGRQLRGLNPADPGPSTARIQSAFIAGGYGGVTPVPQLQYSWHDDHVVSSQPIGCQVDTTRYVTDLLPRL